MARIVVQPGTLTAWEIKLKAGVNSFGRGPTNDFKLGDASVSGSHCQFIVNDGTVILKDLGSTNGTFVNRAPVKEAVLQSGQTIHLGGLEMIFYGDGSATAPVAQAVPVAQPLPPPRAVGAPTARRIGSSSTVALAGPPPGVTVPRPVAAAAPPATEDPSAEIGSGPCKHHPKIPGRYFCGHCQLYFCDACVTTRGQQKSCRHCGSECARVQVQVQRPAAAKGFFTRFPTAFVYPFRGSGLLVLLVSTFVLALLDYISGSWFAILTKIVVFGYLFIFMQNIIHATANEEEEMPDLPGFDDVLGGAFRMGVTVMICFTLPVVFAVLKFFDVMEVSASTLIATMVLGCLYFPMAFLAVAMKDTALAANPLVVIPAIVKVPLGYLVTAVVVIGVFALRKFGDVAAFFAGSATYSTRDMSVLFLMFGLRIVWCLVSVYLLTVSMRILGLLYVTNKHKFGWFDR
jgi:hypothetical protein